MLASRHAVFLRSARPVVPGFSLPVAGAGSQREPLVRYFGARARIAGEDKRLPGRPTSTPEILEPIGRQLGVAHRVLDILWPR